MLIVKNSFSILIFNDLSFIDFANETLKSAFTHSEIQLSSNIMALLILYIRHYMICSAKFDSASAFEAIACRSFQNCKYNHIILENEKCIPYLYSTIYDHTNDAE